MLSTINVWTKYVDILKEFGDMGGILAAQAVGTGWSWEKRVETARSLFDACVAKEQDRYAVAMLELLERAYTRDREANDLTEIYQQFRRVLEVIYWALPDKTTGPGGGSKATLVATKRWIVEKLLVEWVATPTVDSVYAFRRLIAMGWPMQENARRGHQSEVEWLQGRGRCVFEEERKGICEIVRSRMEHFGTWDERKAGADEIFRLWLEQPHVPDELLAILTLNRARMGGPQLAMRDLHYASVLNGIPRSGLDLLTSSAQRLREAAKAVQRVMYEALGTIEGHRHSSYARTHLEDGDRWRFVSEHTIALKVGPLGKAEDLLVAMVEAISRVRADSILKTFDLQLEVAGHADRDNDQQVITLPRLTKSWERER
jgi:hypothetical protein